MATRRQFLTTATAGLGAAILPVTGVAVLNATNSQEQQRTEQAETVRNRMKKYATMAAVAQGASS